MPHDPMTNTQGLADELAALLPELGTLPLSEGWLYTAIRHCQRNMDFDYDDEGSEPNRYAGSALAKLANALPRILTALRSEAAGQGWRPIETHGGRYEVSRSGEVRRSDGLVLGQWLNSQGYALVRLSKPRTTERVHRLVAKAFVENPADKPFVNHLNNDRADNRADNLEWCTQWENLKHAENQQRMQRDYWVGKRSPTAALSDEQVAAIRAEYLSGGVSWEALGKKYGVSKRSIGRIIRGESYV